MAARGNIARVLPIQVINLRNVLMLGAQPTGNGPVLNAAPFVASAFGIIILNGTRSAVVYRTFADSNGIWRFYEVAPGTYYATEVGVSRQWLVEVAGDLSFTVTPVTSSFPRTRAYASA